MNPSLQREIKVQSVAITHSATRWCWRHLICDTLQYIWQDRLSVRKGWAKCCQESPGFDQCIYQPAPFKNLSARKHSTRKCIYQRKLPWILPSLLWFVLCCGPDWNEPTGTERTVITFCAESSLRMNPSDFSDSVTSLVVWPSLWNDSFLAVL